MIPASLSIAAIARTPGPPAKPPPSPARPTPCLIVCVALRAAGVTLSSIAAVIHLDAGIAMNADQVRYYLRNGREPSGPRGSVGRRHEGPSDGSRSALRRDRGAYVAALAWW